MSKPGIANILRRSIFHCTPDIAQLRFRGKPVPVFLWDEYRGPSKLIDFLGQAGHKPGRDFRIASVAGKTSMAYSPLVVKSRCYGKETVVIPNMNKVSDIVPFSLTRAPILGTLLMCSLRVVRTLDVYYTNGQSHDRKVTTVGIPSNHHDKHSPLDYQDAHMYYNRMSSFFRYDKVSDEYEVRSDVDIQGTGTLVTHLAANGKEQNHYAVSLLQQQS